MLPWAIIHTTKDEDQQLRNLPLSQSLTGAKAELEPVLLLPKVALSPLRCAKNNENQDVVLK